MNRLLLFTYLQILDGLSTVIAVDLGATEVNPFTQYFIARLGLVSGLVFVKFIGVLAGLLCYTTDREAVLRWANWAYALVVLSNMLGAAMHLGRV